MLVGFSPLVRFEFSRTRSNTTTTSLAAYPMIVSIAAMKVTSISSLNREKTLRTNNPTEMIPMVAAVAILQLNLSVMKMNIAPTASSIAIIALNASC